MLDSSLIRMAYHEGSDGPRLTLFGPMEAAFNSLHRSFCQLAECAMNEMNEPIHFDCLPWVFAANGIKLDLFSYDEAKPRGIRDSWRFGIRRKSLNHFEWKLVQEDWQYQAELMEHFLSSDTPCHQYLMSCGWDEVTVVISKGEYPDSVLNCEMSPAAHLLHNNIER